MNNMYMDDSYKREFHARVVSAESLSVVLDDTAFYPTSGGQPNDTGIITGSDGLLYTVTNVKKDDGKIVHIVDKEGLQTGEHVKCIINWERRYMLMRMHTAAHVLSSVVAKNGALITGKQLGIDGSRIDFSFENFNKERIDEIADRANKLIEKGAHVKTYFLKKDDALKIPGVVKLAEKMPPDLPELRIVDIDKVDVQACGGTHVRDIREIGKIRVTGTENKGKANRRMYYTVEE